MWADCGQDCGTKRFQLGSSSLSGLHISPSTPPDWHLIQLFAELLVDVHWTFGRHEDLICFLCFLHAPSALSKFCISALPRMFLHFLIP